jgi:hypothetical protein
LSSSLRGGCRGHRRLENGVSDFLAHFLRGGIFAIEGNGQLLFTTAGFAFAFDEPVFLVNIPAGEQHGNEQNEQPEHNVPPLDSEPVGQRFKTPLDEFQNSSKSNFHKRCWVSTFLLLDGAGIPSNVRGGESRLTGGGEGGGGLPVKGLSIAANHNPLLGLFLEPLNKFHAKVIQIHCLSLNTIGSVLKDIDVKGTFFVR